MVSFDEDRLRNTARAVIRFNKYAGGYTEEGMVERIRREAQIAFDKSQSPKATKHDAWDGYWATCGFVLTFWIDEEGRHCVTPSVDPNLFRQEQVMELAPTAAQAARGWVVRPSTFQSDAILMRGARKGDDPFDIKVGFVYAETQEAADQYDQEFNYTGDN